MLHVKRGYYIQRAKLIIDWDKLDPLEQQTAIELKIVFDSETPITAVEIAHKAKKTSYSILPKLAEYVDTGILVTERSGGQKKSIKRYCLSAVFLEIIDLVKLTKSIKP